MQQISIFGAGGFGKEILDIIESSPEYAQIEANFIEDAMPPNTRVNNASVIGGIDYLKQSNNSLVTLAIGNPKLRRKLSQRLESMGVLFATIIDSSAHIRPNVKIDNGSVICARATISTNSLIGNMTIVNIGAIIGHDVNIGAYSVISPGVIILGGVSIGEGVEVGAGAIVHPQVRIGNWCKIAMGAVVYKDVPDYAIVSGNPARVMLVQPEDWYLHE